MIKHSFKRKLFFYYFAIFALFATSILVFQYNREKQYKTAKLDNTLENISDLTSRYIQSNTLFDSKGFRTIDSLVNIIPQKHARITVIDRKGVVMYDNFIPKYSKMENHLFRPEIQKALYSHHGTSIRESATTGDDFYYYAKYYKGYFVRTAMVYNVTLENFLKAESNFIIFIVFMFIAVWIILLFVTSKFGESITKLKDFAVKISNNEPLNTDIIFPNNELGIIGEHITEIYKDLKKTKDKLIIEKDKLYRHLFVIKEGIAVFSDKGETLLTNNHFIQFINIISNDSSINAEHIFVAEEFKELLDFVNKAKKNINIKNTSEHPTYEYSINKSGQYFTIQCIVFHDKGFEIIITDNTKLVKRRILRQQMTSNISHELKTPVASVKGYLETIQLQKDEMDEKKTNYFIDKALAQANRLTYLISDIAELNKIEEAGEMYEFEVVPVKDTIKEVLTNHSTVLEQNNIKVNVEVDREINIKGNRSLVLSIFQNLLENSIKYAGSDLNINLQVYHEDERFYYFSFSDNGIGIEEEHLARIFERFYRVDSGRSRKQGGTGLGLAIVKNAIILHKGEISVKQVPNGGVEFLFSLPKV